MGEGELEVANSEWRMANGAFYSLFAIRLFAFNAAATRLTGGRPISLLISLVAATNEVSRLIGRPPVSRVAAAINAKMRGVNSE